jgi:predicted acyltransferase
MKKRAVDIKMSLEKNTPSDRLLSLDFFRGFTMLLLMVESTGLYNYLVSPKLEGTLIYTIGSQFQHHEWNGLHFWDLIQPFFMFIVGVAMYLSFLKRTEKGESYAGIRKHIFIRSFLLLFFGWWIYCISHEKITFYFQNVLAQLAVTTLLSFLVIRKSATTQIAFSLVLLGISELLYRTFWISGFDQPFIPNHNFGTWVDSLVSGQDLGGHWVSFNAIPTTAHTIWGVLAAKLLMSSRPKKQKLMYLVIAGITGLIIGYGLDPVTPVIKRIATSSFVFASGGWTFLALAFSFWAIDIIKIRRGIIIFTVIGMNSLFIYLFSNIGGNLMSKQVVLPLSKLIFGWSGELNVNIVASLMAAFLMWYLCYWMFKQRIFIKI